MAVRLLAVLAFLVLLAVPAVAAPTSESVLLSDVPAGYALAPEWSGPLTAEMLAEETDSRDALAHYRQTLVDGHHRTWTHPDGSVIYARVTQFRGADAAAEEQGALIGGWGRNSAGAFTAAGIADGRGFTYRDDEGAGRAIVFRSGSYTVWLEAAGPAPGPSESFVVELGRKQLRALPTGSTAPPTTSPLRYIRLLLIPLAIAGAAFERRRRRRQAFTPADVAAQTLPAPLQTGFALHSGPGEPAPVAVPPVPAVSPVSRQLAGIIHDTRVGKRGLANVYVYDDSLALINNASHHFTVAAIGGAIVYLITRQIGRRRRRRQADVTPVEQLIHEHPGSRLIGTGELERATLRKKLGRSRLLALHLNGGGLFELRWAAGDSPDKWVVPALRRILGERLSVGFPSKHDAAAGESWMGPQEYAAPRA